MDSPGVATLVCKYCGQPAEIGGPCPVYENGKHVFVEMRLPAVCKYCGESAGRASECPVGGDKRHVFVEQH